MTDETAKWESRYSQPGYWAGAEPTPFLREVLPLVGKPGAALELAMGEGRNAVYLAQQGWRVTGIDVASAGLAKAEQLAREKGVKTWRNGLSPAHTPHAPGIKLIQANLINDPVPLGPWNLIVVMYFLLRPLLPAIAAALPPGAYLAYETYTVRHPEFGNWGGNREFLLEEGELRAAFADLDILIYREYAAGKGVVSLLARR